MGSQLTKIIGNFQTTLAANISAGGTTGTLSSANDKEGNALPAGKYCMIVNQGQSNEQHMIFDLSGVNMTNIVGVDHSGDVSVGALKDARINNPIKLTDFVNLLRIVEILNGISTLDGTSPMKYDAEPTISDRKQVIHAGYAQDLITGIMGTASDIAAGSTKMTKDQGSKPRAHSTYVREQNTPDMTLKVEAFRGAFIDSIINFAGGNSPTFINPGMGGDITIPTANPANGETVTLTINGTACVFTFVSSIGSTPGNVLIGGTQTITRANLAALINAPGTTNANQVAFTGAQLTAMGLVNCTDDLSSNIFVRATSATVTTFTMAETMAGSGNVVAVNTTKNRYDLLVLNGGALAIRKGTEAVSPTVPTPTTGDTVLVSVYNIPGETAIRDRSAALSGYISDWYDLAVYRTDLITASLLPVSQVTYTAGDSITTGKPLHYSAFAQAGNEIKFDAHSQGQIFSGTVLTVSHTVANNSNRVLIIDVMTGNAVPVTSVTFNGVAATLVDSQALPGSANNQYTYRLIAPTVGTFNIVVTTSAAASISTNLIGTSYYNVDQTTPIEASAKSTTSGGGTFNQSITTLSQCAMLHAGYAYNPTSGTATVTFAGINGSNLLNIASTFGSTKANSPIVETTQSVTIANTHTGSNNRGVIALSLKPAQTIVPGVVHASAAAGTALTSAKQDFVGFATQTVSPGASILVQVGLVASGLSSLTVGKYYYLQDTAGNIGLSPGTVSKIVAKALSTTTAIIIP